MDQYIKLTTALKLFEEHNILIIQQITIDKLNQDKLIKCFVFCLKHFFVNKYRF